MNTQVQRHRSVASDSPPRSAAPAALAEQPNAQLSPAFAEDRSIPSKDRERVDPLWMITAATAALFAFLAAAVAFS